MKSRNSILLLSMVAALVTSSNTIAQSDQVRVSRLQSGIAATLEDKGDYYFHPAGHKIKFYRKKDVYAVIENSNRNSTTRANAIQAHLDDQFPDRVRTVKQHGLGHLSVVKVDNRVSTKLKARQAFDISPQMLQQTDQSISQLRPVFANSKGNGDLLLLPKVTFALDPAADPDLALTTLQKKYGLNLARKLELSDPTYSLAYNNSNLSSSQQFANVRSIMNEPFVVWAEPQMHAKPVKTALPSDPLLADQWHLQNRGFRGSRCDADCDAEEAWDIDSFDGAGAVTGAGMVIAIVDDGVELSHPDLAANIDSINDRDFVDDDSMTVCENGQSLSDGDLGPDNDANPRATANCLVQGEPLREDNHGTAVAGIAAAISNGIGGVGVAYNATILPIRALSDFDEVPLAADDEAFCNTIAEAMEYAAQYADVINNSWSLPIQCMALNAALSRVTAGTVTVGLGSKRADGSPVVFASGNNASGWVKVTVPVSAGEHAYEWRLLRTDFPEDFEVDDDDTVWLDDVTWPDDSVEGFETGLTNFTTEWALNSCNAECTFNLGDEPVWTIETSADFVRTGSQSAKIDALNSDCGNSYLHTLREGPSGEISFWVWVSTDAQAGSDKFEFLVDGKEKISYGDLAAFGFVQNEVAYPASLSATIPGVIAVGASNSGDLSGNTMIDLTAEGRAPYSQYGPTLDVVAPSHGQHLGITTTDRTGTDGFNAAMSVPNSADYTEFFGGTSAAAPIVSGIAAAVLAIDGSLTASEVRDIIRDSADEIGIQAFSAGRNDFVGHGRINMHHAIRLAQNATYSPLTASCSPDAFNYAVAKDPILAQYEPQPSEFCRALGPVPDQEFCVPLKTIDGKVALICL